MVKKLFYYFYFYYICLFIVGSMYVCQNMYVEIRGQLGVGSLLPPCVQAIKLTLTVLVASIFTC